MLDLLRFRNAAPRSAQTLGEVLAARGISRRAFLKFTAAVASSMALPPALAWAARKDSDFVHASKSARVAQTVCEA